MANFQKFIEDVSRSIRKASEEQLLPEDTTQELLQMIENTKSGNMKSVWDLGAYFQNLGNHLPQINTFYNAAYLCYQEAANHQYPPAIRSIGQFYALGLGGKTRDINTAINYYKKAASLGNIAAMLDLGNIYYCGYGVPEDLKKSMLWFTKGATAGNADAMGCLGECYNELGDYASAMHWITASVQSGSTKGLLELGILYLLGHGVKRDEKKCWELWLKAAHKDDANAQYWVARVYLGEFKNIPFGIKRDNLSGLQWLIKAVENENIEASALYGLLLVEGKKVAQNVEQGIRYLESAGNQGNQFAASYLCELYYQQSDIVASDHKKALYWANKAAESGDADDLRVLELFSECGIGATPDENMTLETFRRCEDLGVWELAKRKDC